METWYDMHCHLGFAPESAATAAAGADAGIRALACTVSPAEYEQLQPALAAVPTVATGLGAHPWWIADGRVDEAALARFCALAPTTRFIGEIGLDFAGPRDTAESRAVQTAALERILAACDSAPSDGAPAGPSSGDAAALTGAARPIAAATDTTAPSTPSAPKLISLHAVNATAAVLDRLEAAGTPARHRCLFHWFSGTSDDLGRALGLGCFFSVGPRMLASRRGREYARQIPLDRLLLETDMPAREDEPLPAAVWRADLGNALSGIAQLKAVDRSTVAAQIAATSAELLRL